MIKIYLNERYSFKIRFDFNYNK